MWQKILSKLTCRNDSYSMNDWYSTISTSWKLKSDWNFKCDETEDKNFKRGKSWNEFCVLSDEGNVVARRSKEGSRRDRGGIEKTEGDDRVRLGRRKQRPREECQTFTCLRLRDSISGNLFFYGGPLRMRLRFETFLSSFPFFLAQRRSLVIGERLPIEAPWSPTMIGPSDLRSTMTSRRRHFKLNKINDSTRTVDNMTLLLLYLLRLETYINQNTLLVLDHTFRDRFKLVHHFS